MSELIQGYVVKMNLDITKDNQMQTVFLHPSLSKIMHASGLESYERVIHS